MKYSRKMFFAFAALSLTIASILSGVYYRSKILNYQKAEYEQLEKRAGQIAYSLDTAVDQMEFAVSFILSDKAVLDGMRVLAGSESQVLERGEAAEAVMCIRVCLGTWYLDRNFCHVVVFNENGIAIMGTRKMNEEEARDIIRRQNYADMLKGSRQGRYLRAVHNGNWSEADGEVLSIVQEVKGYQGTYIEVEYDFSKFHFSEEEDFCVYGTDGKLLINNGKQDMPQEALGLGSIAPEEYIIHESGKTGFKVVVPADRQQIDRRIKREIFPDILLMLVFFAVILLLVQGSARYLTKPILELADLMEKRDIRNLKEPFTIRTDIVEVASLAQSFQRLLERLSLSLEMEKKAVSLQLQAQFDALQAGVNPHFIYNVLNVVANRGMMAEDDTICTICSKLASILRYSTNTRSRNAAVREEIQYLENYFYLIQARFGDRFVYEFCVPEKLLEYPIPKLGLQQLAENCISHGLAHKKGRMWIQIAGDITGQGWQITVKDNGTGFAEEKLAELHQKLERAGADLSEGKSSFEIGGMGIINTYLRFYLLYGSRLCFELMNEEPGSLVRITVRESAEEENEKARRVPDGVQGIGCRQGADEEEDAKDV